MERPKASPITHQRETKKFRVLQEINKRGYSSYWPEKKVLGLFWWPMSLICFYALSDAWDFIDKKYKPKTIKHYR